MRVVQRPGFYFIFLLLLAMVALTLWLFWKLPEAEELSRLQNLRAINNPSVLSDYPLSRSY